MYWELVCLETVHVMSLKLMLCVMRRHTLLDSFTRCMSIRNHMAFLCLQAIAPTQHTCCASSSTLCKLMAWHQDGIWQQVPLPCPALPTWVCPNSCSVQVFSHVISISPAAVPCNTYHRFSKACSLTGASLVLLTLESVATGRRRWVQASAAAPG